MSSGKSSHCVLCIVWRVSCYTVTCAYKCNKRHMRLSRRQGRQMCTDDADLRLICVCLPLGQSAKHRLEGGGGVTESQRDSGRYDGCSGNVTASCHCVHDEKLCQIASDELWQSMMMAMNHPNPTACPSGPLVDHFPSDFIPSIQMFIPPNKPKKQRLFTTNRAFRWNNTLV